MLHNFGETNAGGLDGDTFMRFMESELNYYLSSEYGRGIIAEQYVGLPYEKLT